MKNKKMSGMQPQIKRLYMPIIMQTQTFCSYILSTITIHTCPFDSIASWENVVPIHSICCNILHISLNKIKLQTIYAYQKCSNLLLLRPCLRKRSFAFSQHAPTFQSISHTHPNTIEKQTLQHDMNSITLKNLTQISSSF